MHERAQTPSSQSSIAFHLPNQSSRPTSPSDSLRGPPAHVAAIRTAAGHPPPSPSSAPQADPVHLSGGSRPTNTKPTNATSPLSTPPTAPSPPSSLIPVRQVNRPSSRLSQDHTLSTRPSLDLPQISSPLTAHPATAPLLPPSRTESPSSPQAASRAATPKPPEPQHTRREHNNRVSFFDPANQDSISRLVAGDLGDKEDVDGVEETAQATMLSVEEMLEGYDWASDDMFGRKSTTRGAADLVEARLLDELAALEKVGLGSPLGVLLH